MSMVGQMSSGSLNAQEVTAEYRCIGNEYLRMLQFRQVGGKKRARHGNVSCTNIVVKNWQLYNR